MTVREAFEKAYGPIPEGATCHPAYLTEMGDHHFDPVIQVGESAYCFWEGHEPDDALCDEFPEHCHPQWCEDHHLGVLGPDISDRPASAFLGFFGAEYDRVVSEDQAAWRAALHGARISVSDAEDD